MIIIGIDPSLSSTSVCIYKHNDFTLFNYTNSKPNYKWNKEIQNFVNFKFHEHTDNLEYSESEVEKLLMYNIITDNIVFDINNIIDDETEVYIEGYSYSSNTGQLIDLVTFSTLLRIKLLNNKKIKLNIVSPSTLKKSTSDLAYIKDKKGISRNENGLAGGSFKKPDMMVALLEINNQNILNINVGHNYFTYIKENKDMLLKSKNIPKPFDDITDSVLLCYYGINKNKLSSNSTL